MTNEEAKDYIREWCPYDRQEEIIEALSNSDKDCRWKDVLDKIGAEIDQKQYDFMSNKDYMSDKFYDEGVRFGLMLAYQIVNKYKAESEDEVAESYKYIEYKREVEK